MASLAAGIGAADARGNSPQGTPVPGSHGVACGGLPGAERVAP